MDMELPHAEISQEETERAVMNESILGITCGDVGGIGLECLLKAWTMASHPWRARLYAQPEHLLGVAETLNGAPRELALALAEEGTTNDITLVTLDDTPRERPTPGVWNPTWKDVSRTSLEVSIQEALSGKTCGVVTLPITKRIVVNEKERFPGQTELFADRCATTNFAMMLAGPVLRVVPVTTHIPLSRVSEALEQSEIERLVRLLNETLIEAFHIQSPTIAVCGLNPHAGEDGMLGSEEIDIISPAIDNCHDLPGKILGPMAADTLFPLAEPLGVDGILAMYHDQGLIPFKTRHFDSGVNTTIGLPITRTSPDHGVAYGIAGSNSANPESTRSAIQLAWSFSGK